MPATAKSLTPENSEPSAWQPMASAPRIGLILLKTPCNGGQWPMVGRWSEVHGQFCSPPILGLNEVLLQPSAWCEIPPYGDDQ